MQAKFGSVLLKLLIFCCLNFYKKMKIVDFLLAQKKLMSICQIQTPPITLDLKGACTRFI